MGDPPDGSWVTPPWGRVGSLVTPLLGARNRTTMCFPRLPESRVEAVIPADSSHRRERLTVSGDMPEDWAMSETVRGLGPVSGVKRKMVIKMWVWVGVPRLLIRSNAHMGMGAKGP